MRKLTSLTLVLAAVAAGCTADVQTTNDSVKLEAEVPKIEVKGTPDLNPKTDHDVDVDTPKPGDK
jgi:hypothetical protein